MYLALSHFFNIIAFISAHYFDNGSSLSPAKSPLPFSEQKIQPFVDKVPSLFGQVKLPFNAILNTRDGSHLNGCKIYVTLFPCNECAKAIIQTGIKKVIYLSDKYQDQLSTRASKRLFEVAGVEVEQYKGRYTSVELK